jgi:hypothetical protein
MYSFSNRCGASSSWGTLPGISRVSSLTTSEAFCLLQTSSFMRNLTLPNLTISPTPSLMLSSNLFYV